MDQKLRELLGKAMEVINQQNALLQRLWPVAQEMKNCLYDDRKPSSQEVARWTEVEQIVLPALVGITQSMEALH